jgi:hypothetical protein
MSKLYTIGQARTTNVELQSTIDVNEHTVRSL